MSTANLDHADLSAVDYGGLINEDVMQTIWDISAVPLPFTDMIGTDTCKNEYKEWTTDKLNTPDKTNATVDGADASGNNVATGERLGNHCQMPDKVVRVSTRAQAADTIGRSNELAYQIMMRQRELRRDVEAICLSEQGSIADDGNTTAGRSAGFFAMIRDTGDTKAGNALCGTNGNRPGFVSGVVDGATYSTTLFAAGTTRALSEELVRDAVQLAYEDGGNPTKLISVPAVIRAFSNYLFTSSARIASLYSEVGQGSGSSTATGSVNMFITDFGTVELVADRVMQPEVATVGSRRVNIGIIDPAYVSIGYLQGYQVEPLAKTGTADNRQMTVDFTLIVNNLNAHATICDIDDEATVTQATA